MLKFYDFINEELNYIQTIERPLYFEFGEGSVLLKRDNISSHIRERFSRTIYDKELNPFGKMVTNPDEVDNKVPIKPEHILDDILFALPKMIDMLFRGRLELMRGWGMFATPDKCRKIDPKYKPDLNSIRITIRNVATYLNIVVIFNYFKRDGLDYVGLEGVTVIWKKDYYNSCDRKDNIIEIHNDNIKKFYDKYPLSIKI